MTMGMRSLFIFLLLLCSAAPAGVLLADEHAVMSRLAPGSLLLDAATAGELIVAVGERGHILTSRDGGRIWRQGAVPIRSTLTGVFLHDEQLGWAVGHDGVILRTRDGGESWRLLLTRDEEDSPLLDVFFLDEERGFAVGAYGLFLVTENAGDTWEEKYVGDEDWHLNHMARSTSGRLYIAAEAGHIYRSDDDGVTWTSLPSPYAGSFFGTLPLADDTLLLFGLRGHLFRSGDAGNTWQEIATGSLALLSGGLILPDGKVVLVGQEGTILTGRADGLSFDLTQLPDRMAFSTVVSTPDGTMLLVGEDGARRYSE